MSASILDEVVGELHTKHGEEAEHILPEHRVCAALTQLALTQLV